MVESWKRFEQQLNLYVRESGDIEKRSDQKVAIFLNVVGAEALHVYTSLQLSQAEQIDYETVVKTFKELLCLKKRVTLLKDTSST